MSRRLALSPDEVDDIGRFVGDLATSCCSVEDEVFLQEALIVAHGLPLRLRQYLNQFRREETGGYCIISGHSIDDVSVGPTPDHWRQRPQPSPTLKHEILLVLYASLLGDPFGWSTQQDGHLVHEVVPIEGHQFDQLGSSSAIPLTWHIEDAFHPFRGDYLVLACIRNPDRVATILACADNLGLPESTRDVLFEERFLMRPDTSHLPTNNSASVGADFSEMVQLNQQPCPVAVFFGHPEHPYIRFDPYYMDVNPGDLEAMAALSMLSDRLAERIEPVVLEPGDYCFIDNFRCLHGRESFEARFDGTDRWLKRVNVTRDLRKSRTARRTATARTIG